MCSISADSSGELLHRRGYRQAVAKAPLRETLAAAMLVGSGWDRKSPLVDPMCGSGTIAIEGALMARNIAPGVRRKFAFEMWPDHDAKSWKAMIDEAVGGQLDRSPARIIASDRDAGAVTASIANATRAHVLEDIEIENRTISDVEFPPENGWIVSNPPYGLRVGESGPLRNLYASLGGIVRKRAPGYVLALLSADKSLESRLEMDLKEVFRTSNGGIPVRLVMSHELRTPLNSLLILSKLLTDNKDGNLSPKQVEYAKTIHSSGSDLLSLINDVLDIAKVEAGKMEVNAVDTPIAEVNASLDRSFRAIAEQKGLEFKVQVNPDVPAMIYTDGQRVEQILKNLLSNAFKFTNEGSISLTVRKAEPNRRFTQPTLNTGTVVAFAVTDTGIGIPADKQRLIFEAFQQADGTTSRKFGGTGLGLSISREIARLLGGEIKVESAPGKGSTFTLFLPSRYRELGEHMGPSSASNILKSRCQW